jgi:hypothetical protein
MQFTSVCGSRTSENYRMRLRYSASLATTDGMGIMNREGPGCDLFEDTVQTHKTLVKIAGNSTQSQTGYVLQLKTRFDREKDPFSCTSDSVWLSCSSLFSPLGVMALS